MTLTRLCTATIVAAVLAFSPIAEAATVTLSAVQDAQIASTTSLRNTLYPAAGLAVSTGGTPGRLSLYQFDLSGLPGNILNAHLELYATDTDPANAFSMEHYFATPKLGATNAALTVLNSNGNTAWDQNGLHEDFVSYNTYTDAIRASGTPAANALNPVPGGYLESPSTGEMVLNIAAGNNVNDWYASADASAAGLALLNNNKNDKGYVIFLAWRLADGRTFGDHESGFAPRLVVETVPEPATVTLLAFGLLGALVPCVRRRK